MSQHKQKASSTLRASRAVPHPGTDRALRRLTSEFGRDPVHSTRYGRWQDRLIVLFCSNVSPKTSADAFRTSALSLSRFERPKKACDERIGPKVYLEPKWLRCYGKLNNHHCRFKKRMLRMRLICTWLGWSKLWGTVVGDSGWLNGGLESVKSACNYGGLKKVLAPSKPKGVLRHAWPRPKMLYLKN